ncbi:MAG: cytochrome C, partial [Lentisphaeraceae bacterium]|nr:cytochrome C [Lentisphaeraceae bacterium]
MGVVPSRSFLRKTFGLCCAALLAGSLTVNAADKKKKKKKGPSGPQWYQTFNYGPALATVTKLPKSLVVKSQVIKVGAHNVVYDTEMMSFNGAFEGALKLEGTPWNGHHGGNPKSPNKVALESGMGPGWAKGGSFEDPRKYGPLPKDWLKYKGQYRDGDKVVLTYTVGNTSVLEMPSFEDGAYTRTINIAKAASDMTVMIARGTDFPVSIVGEGIKIRKADGNILGDIAAGSAVNAKIVMGKADAKVAAPQDLSAFTKGGPLQWAQTFDVKGIKAAAKGSYVTEEIPLPVNNPWSSKIRFSGFDFFSSGTKAAICTWNGDVWIASGIDKDLEKVTWKRYAAGLFETLGVKIVDDVVYVTGKDQITRLHDLNKDGEADFYENFNNDIKITENFHEFTFDLQTDKEGNFYFAKGAPVKKGGRGFGPTHENHGVVFKVSKDGSTSEVVGNGLRAPGGMGVGPNGEITTGENEGTFVPACKINWVKKGSFSGVIHDGNGRKIEQGYDNPLCW